MIYVLFAIIQIVNQMVMFVWLEGPTSGRVEWRSTCLENGALPLTLSGLTMMQEWSVMILAIANQVAIQKITFSKIRFPDMVNNPRVTLFFLPGKTATAVCVLEKRYSFSEKSIICLCLHTNNGSVCGLEEWIL